MPSLRDVVTDVETLLALGPEDLGAILLQLAQQERAPRFTVSNYEMPLWNANTPAFPHHQRTPVSRAIAEAMQWLMNEGLVMPDPEQSAGYFCLTRKAWTIGVTESFETYRRGHLLPVAMLHPRLADKVRPMFLRGDYDVAVFQAFKEVEVAVRKAGHLRDELVGVALMREAFHPENGPLTDPTKVYAEREAMMHLYGGAIGHGKNPPSHRDVDIEHVSAAQLIGLASYLLTEVDTFVARRQAGHFAGKMPAASPQTKKKSGG